MEKKQQLKEELRKIRSEAIQNAHTYHSDIDVGYYNDKPLHFILAYCHPLERNDFELRLNKINVELKKLENEPCH